LSKQIAFAQQGHHFALGRGKDFFGVWRFSPTKPVLVERWPETPDGWYGAWVRFNTLEEHPELAASVEATPAARRVTVSWPLAPLALLAAGIFCGVVGLFGAYLSGSALTSESDQLVSHALYLATWLVAAALLASPRTARGGALLGLGVSAVSLGFFLSDVGTVAAGGAHVAGAGLVLGLVSWLSCTTGIVLALSSTESSRFAAWPPRHELHNLIPVTVLSIGAAATFAPAWDHYVLHAASNGETNSFTAGNAFSNPAAVIAANVITMALIVAIPLLATIWRPTRRGAFLFAGALVPLVAQVVAALIDTAGTPAPSLFGISAAEARQLGLTISSGLTTAFWVYFAFVLGLVALCLAQGLGITERLHEQDRPSVLAHPDAGSPVRID
jgi:hypothetical protein